MVANRPIVILGGGGHARVVADLIRALDIAIYGVVDPDEDSVSLRLPIEKFLSSSDDSVLDLDPNKIHLAIGVGSRLGSNARRHLFDKFSAAGFQFPPLVHPTAYVATDARLGPGVQIMAGAIVQSGSEFASCSIANTRSSIDHECNVGAFAHVAPGATLCGCVSIGANSFVGPGAVITHNLTIGAEAIVGAGSVVLRDVPPAATLWGIPAQSRHT